MSTYIESRIDGRIAELELVREDKRNAMSDGLLEEIEAFYGDLPKDVRVVVLHGRGGHFCSGLDLAEHVSRGAEEGVYHSRNWHRILDTIQFGGKITVSALTGAVIGGGLELATATHVRIAEPSVIFQLPEGRRGIFVGGGATVRVGRILGADRMVEMMLTGRKYGAEEGLRLGLCALCGRRRRSTGQGPRIGEDDCRECTDVQLLHGAGSDAYCGHVACGRSFHREPRSRPCSNDT